MEYLVLLLVIELVVFGIGYLISNRDILSPSCVMCAMFVVSTVFALVYADEWNVDYGLNTVVVISIGLIIAVATELFCKLLWGKSNCRKPEIASLPQKARNYIFAIMIGFNVVISFAYYRAIRGIVGETSSVGMMFAMYRNMGVNDLAGNATERVGGIINQLLKISKATGYVGVYLLINNFLNYRKKITIQNILLLVICLTSLLHTVMIASRGGILMYLSNILIVYYILWHQKNGWNKNLSWKVIILGMGGIVLGIPAFYYSASLMGRKNTLNILEYVSTYIGGSIVCFDSYMKSPVPKTQWGEESLVNLLKILNAIGIGNTSTSYNLESRNLGNMTCNVYTFFRRPLHDFGLLGMCVFTMIVLMLFSWIYYSKIKGRSRTVKTDCWTLVYGYLYYWLFVSSILQYSVSYVSFGCVSTLIIIVTIYLLITKVRLRI